MARLDTGWHAHPKILTLGWAAMGLHAWSISYCDHTLSDGFVPSGAWPALAGWQANVKRLVAAGLWVACDGGYQVHDYTDYNRTRAQVVALQAEDRDRKRAVRAAVRPDNPPDNPPDSGWIPRAPGPGPGAPLQGATPTPTPSPDAAAPDETSSRRGSQECPNCRRTFIGPYSEHHCAIQRPTRRPVLGKLLPREAREPPPPEVLAELETLERTRANRQAEAARQMQA